MSYVSVGTCRDGERANKLFEITRCSTTSSLEPRAFSSCLFFFLSDVGYRYYVKPQFCHVRQLRKGLFASKNISLLRMLPPSLRKMPHKEHGENRYVRKRVHSQSYVLVPGITVKTRSVIPALQPVGLIIIRMYGVRYEISGRRCAERKTLSGSNF